MAGHWKGEEELEKALEQFSLSDLWSRDALGPLHDLAEDWVVSIVLDRRRRKLIRLQTLQWVSNEDKIRELYTSTDHEDLKGSPVCIPDLLREYDQLQEQAESVVDFTAEELAMLRHKAQLVFILEGQGVDPNKWAALVNILTDFQLAHASDRLDNVSAGSVDSEMLAPTAAYLADGTLQNSFLTRFFALCFLKRLSEEVQNPPHFLMRLTLLQARTRLSRLVHLFSPLNGPSTIDGRELIRELEIVSRHVSVPSLLFSLFRLTLPGV